MMGCYFLPHDFRFDFERELHRITESQTDKTLSFNSSFLNV